MTGVNFSPKKQKDMLSEKAISKQTFKLQNSVVIRRNGYMNWPRKEKQGHFRLGMIRRCLLFRELKL